MKVQGKHINTAQAPNVNQNTNKSSERAVVTASQLQNNTNRYPMIYTNPTHNSESRQIRPPDNREITRLIVTTEKTVHKKDITTLNDNVKTNINNITSNLKEILNETISGPFKDEKIEELSGNLSKLSDSVQTYKDKLHNSSYIHHSSKQKTLTKLDDKLLKLSKKINKIKDNNNYSNTRSDQMYNDNNNKADEFRRGKKTPSKFEE